MNKSHFKRYCYFDLPSEIPEGKNVKLSICRNTGPRLSCDTPVLIASIVSNGTLEDPQLLLKSWLLTPVGFVSDINWTYRADSQSHPDLGDLIDDRLSTNGTLYVVGERYNHKYDHDVVSLFAINVFFQDWGFIHFLTPDYPAEVVIQDVSNAISQMLISESPHRSYPSQSDDGYLVISAGDSFDAPKTWSAPFRGDHNASQWDSDYDSIANGKLSHRGSSAAFLSWTAIYIWSISDEPSAHEAPKLVIDVNLPDLLKTHEYMSWAKGLDVGFSFGGPFVASSNSQGAALYSLSDTQATQLVCLPSPCKLCAISEDGSFLATLSQGLLIVWSVPDCARVAELDIGSNEDFSQISFQRPYTVVLQEHLSARVCVYEFRLPEGGACKPQQLSLLLDLHCSAISFSQYTDLIVTADGKGCSVWSRWSKQEINEVLSVNENHRTTNSSIPDLARNLVELQEDEKLKQCFGQLPIDIGKEWARDFMKLVFRIGSTGAIKIALERIDCAVCLHPEDIPEVANLIVGRRCRSLFEEVVRSVPRESEIGKRLYPELSVSTADLLAVCQNSLDDGWNGFDDCTLDEELYQVWYTWLSSTEGLAKGFLETLDAA